MLLMQFALVPSGDGAWWRNTAYPYDGVISRETLAEYFDIPAGVQACWLSLHNRSSRDRHKAEIEANDYDEPFAGLADTENATNDAGFFHATLEPLVGKTVWVQVEYAE